MTAANRLVSACGLCRRLLVVTMMCFVLLSGARAGDFEKTNDLFDEGKFAEAKGGYEKLIEQGQGSANVFYNLANADYRLGSAGRAMLNYERALVLDPSHPEARANLKILRERSGAKLPTDSWRRRIFVQQSLAFWTIATAVAAWLAVFSLAGLATGARAGKGALWLLMLLGFASAAFAGTGAWFGWKDASLGVVTAQQTEARLAPARSAGVAEALPAGSRVRVLSERGAWIYCELPGAGRGWVPEGTMEWVWPQRP